MVPTVDMSSGRSTFFSNIFFQHEWKIQAPAMLPLSVLKKCASARAAFLRWLVRLLVQQVPFLDWEWDGNGMEIKPATSELPTKSDHCHIATLFLDVASPQSWMERKDPCPECLECSMEDGFSKLPLGVPSVASSWLMPHVFIKMWNENSMHNKSEQNHKVS